MNTDERVAYVVKELETAKNYVIIKFECYDTLFQRAINLIKHLHKELEKNGNNR